MPLEPAFDWGARTYVMGIINVTPDSFSGDGLDSDTNAAVEQAHLFAADGADILDIGGESTRPGHTPVDVETELSRVVPAVRAIAASVSLPISIDTTKATVARAALDAGATIVNDVWALSADSDMARLIAERDAWVVLMHNRSEAVYTNFMSEVVSDLRGRVDVARAAGIRRERIIIDPGIGFGKTAEHNLEIINRLDALKTLDIPILLGASRKRFIGHILGDLPPQERVEGTAAAVAIGIARGADIVRVHDVKAMTRVARVTDAIIRHTARTPTTP